MKSDTAIQTAILGTSNVPLPPDLLAFFQQEGIPVPENPEAAILLAGLIVSRMEMAGYIPGISFNELSVCPDETQPYLGKRGAYYLTMMLSGTLSHILPEFLDNVILAGKIAPPEILPELLDAGTRKRSLQKSILKIGGERMRWLAALQPEMAWASGAMEASWEDLEASQRAIWLEEEFASNPEQILLQIEETWKGETPELRKRICEIIARFPSPAVEDFLEMALKDSRKEVREAASSGLAEFPAGRYSNQVGALLAEWVGVQKKLFKTQLTIELPEAYPAALEALGIPANVKVIEGGEKANWLAELAARSQPAHWRQIFGQDLKLAMKLVLDSDWKPSLLHGWIQVAAHSQDYEMMDLVLTKEHFKEQYFMLEPILKRLTTENLQRLVDKFAGMGQLGMRSEGTPITRLLSTSSCSISTETANRTLEILRKFVREQGDYSITYATQSMIDSLALRFSPEMADAAAQNWPEKSEGWPSWEKNVLKFLSTLRHRAEMLQSIQEKS